MRNVGVFFVLCMMVAASPVHAGDVIQGAFGKPKSSRATQPSAKESSETALRVMVTVEPAYRHTFQDLKDALHVIENIPPEGVRLDRATSEANADFVIEVSQPMTPEYDLLPHPALKGVLDHVPANASSYSLVMDHLPEGPFIVRVFWDRFGNRPDSFARLISILGREIYGNVLTFKRQRELLLNPAHRYGDAYREEDRLLFERAAAQGAIDTLNRMLKLAMRSKMPKSEYRDIVEALQREHKVLEGINRPAIIRRCESLF